MSKGSAPRKQADYDAFRRNWEQIFGVKKPEPRKCEKPYCICKDGECKAEKKEKEKV